MRESLWLTEQGTNRKECLGGQQLSEPIAFLLPMFPSAACNDEGCLRKREEGGGAEAVRIRALGWLQSNQTKTLQSSAPSPSRSPSSSECSPGPGPLKQERSGRSSAFLQPSANSQQPCLSVGMGWVMTKNKIIFISFCSLLLPLLRLKRGLYVKILDLF